jgi:GNAT superfamily N-acetyltransferase
MLNLHEITRVQDPEVVPFTRMLQTLFPLEEQVRMADVIELLQRKSRGGARRHHLFTAADEAGDTVAMAWCERWLPRDRQTGETIPLTLLWYMGVDTPYQSQGCGSRLYRELCERAFAEGCRAVVMEVERPDVAAAHGPERAREAERRLRFYVDRRGARVLHGIEYQQETGWQPPVPMHLLVQSPPSGDALPAPRLYGLLRQVFGRCLKRRKGAEIELLAEW